MKTPKIPTTEELSAQHAELERTSQPLITEVTELAKKALALQVEIFTRQFKSELPAAKFIDAVLLTTFPAREKPHKFFQLMTALKEKKVEVTHVVYDAMNYSFHLYGKATV